MPGVILTTATKVKTGLTRYEITWVSDASGNVSGSTFTMNTGTIVAVEFVPGVGLTQPDNLYDVDVLDSRDISIFDDGSGTSIGSNLSNVTALHKVPLSGLVGAGMARRWTSGGAFEPLVGGAGDTNTGTIDIYMVEGLV